MRLGLALIVAVAGCGDDGAAAGPDAGIADVGFVRVSDVLNAFDGSDIEVAFSAIPDAPQVSEYRVLVADDDEAGTLDTPAAANADHFTTVGSDGAPTGLRLAADARTIAGDAIVGGVSYRVFILAVATTDADVPDALSSPSRELILDGSSDILVSSSASNAVKRFDGQTGRFLGDFVAPGANGLGGTQEVVIGPDDQVYVTGIGNAAVKKYDVEQALYLGDFTSGYTLNAPTKTRFGPDGHLYVAQWGATRSSIARFDGTTGAFIDEATPDLDQPMDQAWDDAGVLHVVSFGSLDVRRFEPDGTELEPLVTSDLSGPVNLMFTGDGDLLVVDWRVGSVKRFDATTGAFEEIFITGMTRSEGIAIGYDGYFYVCDWQDNEVNRYDSTGAFVDEFLVTGGLQTPNSVTFRANPPAQ